ncbi:MAG TPA: winged helix DNA-binding domain-containing protein, partial [Chloroflexota bacterium]|nr:winged helix DNA-binding domain-containing protein [Chloroflexota bacterium]
MSDLTPSDVLRLRLANQHLASQRLTDPTQLVAHFGAVQAQDLPSARWALGQRLRAATEASIEQALADGAILRTHVMRPTWHFVAPQDIRWLLALTAPRVRAVMSNYTRALGIDAALIERTNATITMALKGGRYLTRTELGASLRSSGIEVPDKVALCHIFGFAELDGVVCSGPKRGKQQTYALLEERVPPTPTRDRDEALAELTRRYFTSHGPATLRDFAWWSGLTIKDGELGVALNGPALEQHSLDGQRYWCAPIAGSTPSNVPPAAETFLLPRYDEYTVAFTRRELFF